MSQKLANLRSKLREAARIKGKIIQIESWRFVCPNHGKEKMVWQFTKADKEGNYEIECDCGTIYQKT